MTALPPDYASDPGRWGSWKAPQDAHDMVAPELRGPVLDVGCGEGGSQPGSALASTSARDNDPEIMSEGYPPGSFDAEEAVAIGASVFGEVKAQRWDGKFYPLQTRDEIRAYCRASYIPGSRAETADVPLWLIKRGVLVRARKPAG
jgi:hypothetical protein